MKSRNIILFAVFALSIPAFAADSFTLTEINSNGKRAEVKVQGKIEAGDILRHTDKFDERCDASVIKTSGATAIIDISACENAKSLKPGAVFTATGKKASAAATEPEAEEKEQSPYYNSDNTKAPTIDEDWYTLWGAGFSAAMFSDDRIDDAMDVLENQEDGGRSGTNLDLFGFYWPWSDKKTMHGVIFNSVVETASGTNDELAVVSSLLGYSLHRFYGRNIGDGWFVRGDLGISRASVLEETSGVDTDDDKDVGFGALAGGGYGLAAAQGTRILIGGYLTTRKNGGLGTTAVNLNVGVLF